MKSLEMKFLIAIGLATNADIWLGLQMAMYIALGAIGLSMFTYSISRPGKDGEDPKLSKWIDGFRAQSQQTWEHRNALRTDLKEQAAADKHLFYSVEKAKGFELRTPEYVLLAQLSALGAENFSVLSAGMI